MKKIEDYLNTARNFNSGVENPLNLKVIKKPKIDNNNGKDRGSVEYVFSDGVIVRHSWNGNIYFGHQDYDHNIEIVNDAGYEFEQKSLFYNMQKSNQL